MQDQDGQNNNIEIFLRMVSHIFFPLIQFTLEKLSVWFLRSMNGYASSFITVSSLWHHSTIFQIYATFFLPYLITLNLHNLINYAIISDIIKQRVKNVWKEGKNREEIKQMYKNNITLHNWDKLHN